MIIAPFIPFFSPLQLIMHEFLQIIFTKRKMEPSHAYFLAVSFPGGQDGHTIRRPDNDSIYNAQDV